MDETVYIGTCRVDSIKQLDKISEYLRSCESYQFLERGPGLVQSFSKGKLEINLNNFENQVDIYGTKKQVRDTSDKISKISDIPLRRFDILTISENFEKTILRRQKFKP